jgi:hypothetical protein
VSTLIYIRVGSEAPTLQEATLERNQVYKECSLQKYVTANACPK